MLQRVGQKGIGLDVDSSWKQLYQAALGELDPGEIRKRIDAAETAIYQRAEELKQSKTGWGEELWAMHDALRRLRVLADTEGQLQTARPSLDPKSWTAT